MEKQRKLILHFDNRNTIHISCKNETTNCKIKNGINNFLTCVTWGREVNGAWEWVCDKPQMKKPIEFQNDKTVVTYFRHLEKILINEDRIELRKRTTNFVNEEPGIKFKSYFDRYIHSLKYGEIEQDKNELPVNTIRGDDNSLYHYIFPEFFDLIRHLQKSKRKFAIILRTMGIDSKNFLDTITPVFEGKHRDFRDIEKININYHVGNIRRNDENEIEFELDGNVYKTELEIYNKLNSIEGICAIRDDFAYWQKNNYECYSAKPIWLNFSDKEHQHILFDDNIRLEFPNDCIVNLRLFSDNDFYNIDFSAYDLFQHSTIIQPDLIDLLNKRTTFKINNSESNFYLDKIMKAELRYDDFLNKLQGDKIPLIKDEKKYDRKLTKINKDDLDIFNQRRQHGKITNEPSQDSSEDDKTTFDNITKTKKETSRTCELL